jgi:transposase
MSRNTRLSARYWSWVKRLGKKKALVALGHTMLRIIYQILLTKTPYIELGTDYVEKKKLDREQRMIRELEGKGFVISKVS